MDVKRIHASIPAAVGINAAKKVHRQLLVSFRMVRSVVEQGQCIKENNMKFIAVIKVHPCAASRLCICVRSFISVRLPWER